MTILVSPYQPIWATQFQQIHTQLAPALAPWIKSIEHVGSTSVPGLAAKPILDIDIIVDNLHDTLPHVIRILQTFNYTHRGDLGIEGRHAFQHKTNDPKRNMYVCQDACVALRNHLILRDHLRQHPSVRDAYGTLKMQLAQRVDNIDAYLDGKTDFILAILAQYDLTPDDLGDIENINKLPKS